MDWIHEALTAVVEHLLGLTLRQVPKFSHQNCGIDLLWIPFSSCKHRGSERLRNLLYVAQVGSVRAEAQAHLTES